MHLVFLGVHEDHPAMGAGVVDRVVACLDHGRRIHDVADTWGCDESKRYALVCHCEPKREPLGKSSEKREVKFVSE